MVDNESVARICDRILEDGENEIKSILDKAEQTAADITGKAEGVSKSTADAVIKEARRKGDLIKRRILSSVNLEVKRAKLKARESIVAEVNGKVEEALGSLRDKPRYAGVLSSMIAESVRALDGENFVIFADRRDIGLIESEVTAAAGKMLEGEGRRVERFEVEALKEAVLGGLRVGVPGGNVIFDNTFEARIYRMQDEIRSIIFDEIFSKEASEEQGSA